MNYENISIDSIGLSVRSSNALHRAGIHQVSDMLQLSDADLNSIRNLGKKSIEEIIAKIYALSVADGDSLGDIIQVDLPEKSIDDVSENQIGTVSIKTIGLSIRSIHGLNSINVNTIGEMVLLSEQDLLNIRNMGRKSVDEIMQAIEKYGPLVWDSLGGQTQESSGIDPYENFSEWIKCEDNQKIVKDYLEQKKIGIEELDLLSAKAFNFLKFAGYDLVSHIAFLSANSLMMIPRIDQTIAEEIERIFRDYIICNKKSILDACGVKETEIPSTPQLSISTVLMIPKYHDRILRYAKKYDVKLASFDLSLRLSNCLIRENKIWMSDVIFETTTSLARIKNMGHTSVDELMTYINVYLSEHGPSIVEMCQSDSEEIPEKELTENDIKKSILEVFNEQGFSGLHLPEIIDKGHLGDIDEEVVKHCIGQLIANNELEYVDYRCYRKFVSFSDYIANDMSIDDRARTFIERKIQGDTLEAIGQDFGLSRERVRQVIIKEVGKIHRRYMAQTGLAYFDEDYYQYFYSTYNVDRRVCIEWFGVPETTYYYIDMFNQKGKKDISEALDDSELDVGLKLKINNYLNRNKIFIDGVWIEKRRAELEDYVVKKYCVEDTSFDDFVRKYNEFLAYQGLDNDEELVYTEDVYRTRQNKMSSSNILLWKQNQMLRYYDILGRDFGELLSELDLENYENTELSTLKFIELYPELMERFDIRDQYELHNLLRKIIPEGSYNNFQCLRMPIIRFGEFDRDSAILELLIDNAPISAIDLAQIVHDEYGYDINSILMNGFNGIKEYLINGTFVIDYPEMPIEQKERLREALTEDCYLFNEIKTIYRRLYPEGNVEFVNPYTLKSMGYIIGTKYILQNHSSFEEYIRSLVIRDEIVDISVYRKRFSTITTWGAIISKLKYNYEIFEFEPNMIISFKRLRSFGVTKEELIDFCEQVYHSIPQEYFFSAQSLRLDGFHHSLYDLGFSDYFYAYLLSTDARFAFTQMFGTMVLYKGEFVEKGRKFRCMEISTKALVEWIVKNERIIGIYELMGILHEKYGCVVKSKTDILIKLSDSIVYFDPILERLYANSELYYREIDADVEGV